MPTCQHLYENADGERVVCPECLLEELRHSAAELCDRIKLEQQQAALAEWERTGNAIMRHVCGREAPLSDADVIAEVDRLRSMLDAETAGRFQAVAEVQRLTAIVDRLPKTEDGVPVTPEMTLWPLHEIDDEEGGTVSMIIRDNLSGETMTIGEDANAEKCYSTREAAIAAKGTDRA